MLSHNTIQTATIGFFFFFLPRCELKSLYVHDDDVVNVCASVPFRRVHFVLCHYSRGVDCSATNHTNTTLKQTTKSYLFFRQNQKTQPSTQVKHSINTHNTLLTSRLPKHFKFTHKNNHSTRNTCVNNNTQQKKKKHTKKHNNNNNCYMCGTES